MTDKYILNLSGCSLNQVLFLVSQGKPIFAYGNGVEYMITGYDYHNVKLVNISNGASELKGLQDAGAYFTSAGNRFYTMLSK